MTTRKFVPSTIQALEQRSMLSLGALGVLPQPLVDIRPMNTGFGNDIEAQSFESPSARTKASASDRSIHAAAQPAQPSAEIALAFNDALLAAIRDQKTPPPLAARNLAMVSAAMHDAMVAVDRSFAPLVVRVRPVPGASAQAAAAQAGFEIARKLYPEHEAQFAQVLSLSLAQINRPQARIRGIWTGRNVAESLWAKRMPDGSETTATYQGVTAPGQWRPTPPAFAPALLPQWPKVKTMVPIDLRSIMPPGFPDIASPEYARDFEEVKTLGSANSTARTADQTAIAQFWADGAGTFTPPGHWNQIARNAAESTGMNFRNSVRMFAMLNAALCDAGIACWACKYDVNAWRPVTAIREAATDGNPATEAESAWTPLLATPPFPAYVSGHSSFSGAASVILGRFFGSNYAFEDTGDPGKNLPSRHFASFAQAAEEAGKSRIYGGIHFQADNRDGLALGRAIGTNLLARLRR